MTQSPSVDTVLSEALAPQPADPALAPRTRSVARLLIVLIAVPAALALALTGLWVTNGTRTAASYGQVGQLAAAGQQVTGLVQAMANERSATAAFIAGGRPAADLPALRRQYAVTDARAARARRLVSQLGNGYPAQVRAAAAQALASIAKLPALRRQAQGQAPALAAITGYSAALSGLFPLDDATADLSPNATLNSSVRALGSLSRMIDAAAQQQAILGVALAESRFGPGALTALTTAQAQQISDIAAFRSSATAEESRALAQTFARPPARQAQAVEQRATAAGNGALALGPRASQQWSAGMSYTVGWMDHAEQQLAAWLPADAQALQRSAMRSALMTGAAALAILALVLLAAILAARSMARRLRRLEAATLDGAAAPLPISAGAVSAGFVRRNQSLLEELLGLIDGSELHEDDPERLASLFEMDHLATRIWRNSDSALALAGDEIAHPAEPLDLVDLLRSAASEIEEYGRVVLDAQQGVFVNGSAATDTVHLLAELLENAATFSPERTQVIVSGHAVVGGGSLITIADAGRGMSDEELTLLNQQLASPSTADMTVARRLGLLAVAVLAARHGIMVTLSRPLDGGTTAEVYLPAALISLDAPSAWQARPGAAPQAGAREETLAQVVNLPFSALRFASGPTPPGPETDVPEAVPAMLGAPVPSAPPGTADGVTESDPADAEPGDGTPIYESVRSGYLQAFGRDMPRFSEQAASQSPAAQPGIRPASWGDGNGRGAAGPAAADPPATSGLPRRPAPPRQVHSTAADQETQPDAPAESAETTRDKLASFQRGSQRARAVAQASGTAKQSPGQGG